MAVGLRFTDGTTTVTLSNGTTGYLTFYNQGTAPAEVEAVTDKAEVILLSSLSTIQATVVSLNRLFHQAYLRITTGLGPRVFVERDLGDSVWWRSEIKEAVLVQTPNTLDIELAAGKMKYQIVINRYNWWEGAEADVPLTNANGTDNTSGLTVYNHDDAGAGHDNFVTIDGVNDIAGDLPAPCELTIYKSASTQGSFIYQMWVGQNWMDTSLPHILEFESGESGTSNTSDSSSSGGYRRDYSIATGSTPIYVESWAISAANTAKFAGMYVQPLLRLASATNVDKFRFMIKVQVTIGGQQINIYTSEYTQPASAVHLVELPSFRLPSYLPNQTSYAGVTINLYAINTHTGSVTLQGDFIQLTPLQGWRKYDYLTTYVSSAYTILDDSINREFYLFDGSNYKYVGSIPYGEQIMIRPGKDQRLYFLWRAYDVASIGYSVAVSLDYRPRRLTI